MKNINIQTGEYFRIMKPRQGEAATALADALRAFVADGGIE